MQEVGRAEDEKLRNRPESQSSADGKAFHEFGASGREPGKGKEVFHTITD